MTTLKENNLITKIGCFVLWIGLLFFCYLMFNVTIPYITPPFPTDIDFLLTKQKVIRFDLWRWSFYIHITSSFFVLLSGATQFSKTILQRYTRLHRNIGKLYVTLILLISAPSGLIMAFYSNGGVLGHIAFILQAVLWWGFTYLSYHYIRQRNVREHGRFMFLSYAMTFSAVSLRAFIFLIGWLNFDLQYNTTYLLAAWSSWTFNLLLAGLVIKLGGLDYFFKK